MPVQAVKVLLPICRKDLLYKASAIAAFLGITSVAVGVVYYRFAWQLNASGGGDFPIGEAAATLLLTLGGMVRNTLCILHIQM